jgi:uncharacterized RDD family membrane protein YckC
VAFCPQCGTADQDSAFCSNCGTSIAPQAASIPVAPEYDANQSAIGQYADWGTRFGAYLIDSLTLLPFSFLATRLGAIGSFVSFLLPLWYATQVGGAGSSPGMRVLGIKCVNQTTGQPIGSGMGIVRYLAHFVDGIICGIGFLFPLWDKKRQTLADKLVSTVVIVVPKKRFSLIPN